MEAVNTPVTSDQKSTREWLIFAYQAFGRIATRKHGLIVPELDFENIPLNELEVRVRVVNELAHLPPS